MWSCEDKMYGERTAMSMPAPKTPPVNAAMLRQADSIAGSRGTADPNVAGQGCGRRRAQGQAAKPRLRAPRTATAGTAAAVTWGGSAGPAHVDSGDRRGSDAACDAMLCHGRRLQPTAASACRTEFLRR